MINKREPVKSLPEDNLSYPALITFDNAEDTGTGFFISCSKGIFFVTASHVLRHADEKAKGRYIQVLAHDRDLRTASSNVLRIDLKEAMAANCLRPHPTHDVCVIQISSLAKDLRPEDLTGELADRYRRMGSAAIISRKAPFVTYLAESPNGPTSIAIAGVRPLADVVVGAKVYTSAYPSSIGLEGLPQFDYKKPLLRSGIVAGKYEEMGTLVLDCSVYPGDSGGPILEVAEYHVKVGLLRLFRLCGVVSQFVPYGIAAGDDTLRHANSGYSIATSIDPVVELLGVADEINRGLPEEFEE